jgi:hypothetical protein
MYLPMFSAGNYSMPPKTNQTHRLRLLSYQCSHGLRLVSTPFQWLLASAEERIYLQIRYLNSIARIDFVTVYELVSDWLW